MAKVKNTFIRSKMNKDLDARIIPDNEYRNAVNVQVNKSEGENVGSLENVLGNSLVRDVSSVVGIPNLKCIGQVMDDSTGTMYLFFTNYTDKNPANLTYSAASKSFIVSYNVTNQGTLTILAQGPFLNFSTTHPIYGVNILENLLFWTDNRNQPRKINVDLANPTNQPTPTYYTTEDQISVAKYNPYECIELYAESKGSTSANTKYETTMKDVTSKYYPNGGEAAVKSIITSGDASFEIKNLKGYIAQEQLPNPYDVGANVSYISTDGSIIPITSAVVDTVTFAAAAGSNPAVWTVNITGATMPALAVDTKIVFNYNKLYEKDFPGDDTYLEDKFVRFAYRFKYVDDEYSLFSTFTQSAFIPRQDGYFLYVNDETRGMPELDDQSEAYRSTVVSFVENKVDKIQLRIPLPYNNYDLRTKLLVDSVDILYRESDQSSVKVIDTIERSAIFNQSANCVVNGDTTNSDEVLVSNVQGGIQIGSYVTGFGIDTNITVLDYEPDNPNINPSTSGKITLSSSVSLTDLRPLTIGEPMYLTYDYNSQKPFKTLPEKDLIRVYDQTPVRALAQEVSGNRVIYGNFLNKHTAPESIDYLCAIDEKSDFNLNEVTATHVGAGTFAPGQPISATLIKLLTPPDGFFPGMEITSNTTGTVIPEGTTVVSTNNNGTGVVVSASVVTAVSGTTISVSGITGFIPIGATVTGTGIAAGTTVVSTQEPTPGFYSVLLSQSASVQQAAVITFTLASSTDATITLSDTVTFPIGTVILTFKPGAGVANRTSKIEYPNSSVKTNRNYQVGIVLSDRYGRQSGTILSNNQRVITLASGASFKGDTSYSPYNDENVDSVTWPGNSIKILFNTVIGQTRDPETARPGIYNGDSASNLYNPLGWYSFKIVVKQTEQDYYNVYLPGIMASYPENQTLEIGETSHAVLISDNINKVPRDLAEVGPLQDQFRSSVRLFGRVQNSSVDVSVASTNLGLSNEQYYPGRTSDFASTISTVRDMFSYDSITPPQPNFFPQFYSIESNPYVARINTANKIGQLADVNFTSVSGLIAIPATSSTIQLSNVIGDTGDLQVGDIVSGPGFPSELAFVSFTPGTSGPLGVALTAGSTSNTITVTGQGVTSLDVGMSCAAGTGSAQIPEGTVIVNIDSTVTPVEVELSNIVNVSASDLLNFSSPAQLVTSAPVVQVLGDQVNIYSASAPGIQYLAVYETDPVDSLLDIFWETSTTGVIKNINDIILNENAGGGGAAGLNQFNDTPFLESLTIPSNGVKPSILTGPVFLVDNFNAQIPSLDIDTPLSLDSVVDGYGTNVQDGVAYEGGPVFAFAETNAGSNQFDLTIDTGFTGVLTPGLQEANSVWYGEDELLRTFTFTFSAVVNDLPFEQEFTANLGNVSPHIPTGVASTMKVLISETIQNGLIKVYDASPNAVNIQLQDSVLAVGFPNNTVTVGTGFSPLVRGAVDGYLQNVGWPTVLNVGERYVQVNTVRMPGWVQSYLVPGLELNSAGFAEYMEPQGITSAFWLPPGTYIVSTNLVIDPGGEEFFDVTFNKLINWQQNEGGGMIFNRPATLNVNSNITVTNGTEISVIDQSQLWDDCPLPTFIPTAEGDFLTNQPTEVENLGLLLKAVNGAGWNSSTLDIGNSNSWKDITFEITSQTYGNNIEVDYFVLDFDNQSYNEQRQATIPLLNAGYQDPQMPAQLYTVNYRVSDPEDFIDCSIDINLGLSVTQVQEWTTTATLSNNCVNCADGCGPADGFTGSIVTMFLLRPGGGAIAWGGDGTNGYYAFVRNNQGSASQPSWNALVATASSGNIVIDGLENTYYNMQDQCRPSGWFGPYTTLQDTFVGGLNLTPGLLTAVATRGLCLPDTCLAGAGNATGSQVPWVNTGGFGSNTPLDPPVENYSFTFQASNP
jgi:hypothetical protein